MIVMGLDLSINSTGVCAYNTETKETKYHIIGDKFTKKALTCGSVVDLIQYGKQTIDKSRPYYVQEESKTLNIYRIMDCITNLIHLYQPDYCGIEGVAFCANGDVVGLSGLNYAVRMMLYNNNVDTYIISPTQNKKYATGNGQADKELMVSAWMQLDETAKHLDPCIKKDDIADAYFLARYVEGIIRETV